MCDGLSVELRQQFSYEYSAKKNIWNILIKENYAQFRNWGSQKEKYSRYSKYPTQGKVLYAKGWALCYDSYFPKNIQQRKIFEIFEISYSRKIMRNSVIGGQKRKNILNILHKEKHCVQWVERWATTAIFL